jgi:outer membrane protein assembly factor BamA
VFNYVIHKYDIVTSGEFLNPALNNFFGFGNETVKEPGVDISFYRVRFKDFSGNVLLRKRLFFDKLRVDVGPSFYYYWARYADNAGRILGDPSAEGLDSASIYRPKLYAGGKLRVNVNNVNSTIFPTRGVDWTNDFTCMAGANSNSSSITSLLSQMTIYSSLSDPATVVAVTRLGAGHIFSNYFEYFQAMSLGANNFLRGFRKNRFSGQSLAYASIELRVKLFDLKAYILQGDIGLIGFNDVGRVWMPDETSRQWHDAYGGGVYYLPFHMIMMSGTLAVSSEGTLFNFTIGMKINDTF